MGVLLEFGTPMPGSKPRRRRPRGAASAIAGVLALSGWLGLAVAPAARADGAVSISASSPNILGAQDAPVALRLRGVLPAASAGPNGSYAYQSLARVSAPGNGPPAPCDAADVPLDPTAFWNLSAGAGAPFDVRTSYRAEAAGTFAVCAWLVAVDPTTGDSVVVAVSRSSFSVRAPHLKLGLTAPRTARAGATIALGVTAGSDGEADLDLVIWTPGQLLAPVSRCQNHVPGIRPLVLVSSTNAANGNIKPRRTLRSRRTVRLRHPGVYHVCAYLNSAYADTAGSVRGRLIGQRTVVVHR